MGNYFRMMNGAEAGLVNSTCLPVGRLQKVQVSDTTKAK